MNVLPKLRKSFRDGTSVCLTIGKPGANYYYGIVCLITPSFVVLHRIEELEFNGLCAISLRHIKEVRVGSFSKATDLVLTYNRQLSKLRTPVWVQRCETWYNLFSEIKRRNIWPSAEVVQKMDLWFLIGPILSVEEDGSYIHHYDGDGKWQKRPDAITYKFLRLVMWNDRYSKNFNRYMRTRLP